MVWKRTENEPNTTPATPSPGAVSAPPPRVDPASVGPSIVIKGDITGEEDLIIQGQVEGGITLKQNNVTVGQKGRVKADIHGRTIRVEGEVRGNLYGQEEIVIRKSGTVEGNIVAPRVTLENGSKFKGSIDMEPGQSKSAASEASPSRTAAASSPVARSQTSLNVNK